jgi:hypothetical protein
MLHLKGRRKKEEGVLVFLHFTDALKKAPHEHLNSPTVIGFLPFGSIFQVFSGMAYATSLVPAGPSEGN